MATPGRGTGASLTVVLVVLFLAVVAMWWVGGLGSLTEAFSISILPLSLAVAAIALISISFMGRSNPAMTFAAAAIAGLFGWVLGLVIQAQWLAFDRLYVAPLFDLFSGDLDKVSFFNVSAAFVVAAMIFALVVMGWNALSTIRSDDGLQLVR